MTDTITARDRRAAADAQLAADVLGFIEKQAPRTHTVTEVATALWGDVRRWGKANLACQAALKDGTLRLANEHPRRYAWASAPPVVPSGIERSMAQNGERATRQTARSNTSPVLDDLGVTPNDSSRWQQVADPRGAGAGPGERKTASKPRRARPKPSPKASPAA